MLAEPVAARLVAQQAPEPAQKQAAVVPVAPARGLRASTWAPQRLLPMLCQQPAARRAEELAQERPARRRHQQWRPQTAITMAQHP